MLVEAGAEVNPASNYSVFDAKGLDSIEYLIKKGAKILPGQISPLFDVRHEALKKLIEVKIPAAID